MLRGFELGIAMVAVVALFSMPMAFSDSAEICIGVLPLGVHEKVVVPKNETCTIDANSVVLKNVKVKQGATLQVYGGEIEGKINLEKESSLFMFGGMVGKSLNGKQTNIVVIAEGSQVGKIDIKKGTGETTIVDSFIEKGVKVAKQSDGFVFIKNNDIGGNLKVHKGDTEISTFIKENTIGGNLNCKNNSPPPLSDGFINTVAGLKKNQCSAELGF